MGVCASPTSSWAGEGAQSSKVGVAGLADGDVGGFKVTFGGLLVSCNHSGVVEKRVRLVAGGLFCCVCVMIGGCGWLLPGRWRNS